MGENVEVTMLERLARRSTAVVGVEEWMNLLAAAQQGNLMAREVVRVLVHGAAISINGRPARLAQA